jgi:putative ABC transport system permease protein
VNALIARVRSLGLQPDLEGWSQDALRLAGVKGVVQAETARLSAIQLALQRRGIRPDTPPAQLEAMSPTAVWLIIISLVVCGVGITNAMLMSVSERFREIGTMKCLGALDGFIVKLFLLESTFQGVAGTAIGVVIGFAVMTVANLTTFGRAAFDYFPAFQMVTIVVWGLVIGSGLSIAGAVFPALRAAHMAPVEAMRVEE